MKLKCLVDTPIIELPDHPFISIEESNEPIVDITAIDPRIKYDQSYYKLGYKDSLTRCYVRESVCDRLLSALKSLPDNYSFLVFDTLRTVAAQRSLYDDCKATLSKNHPNISADELLGLVANFVASPTINLISPSPHMTGGAIDLTILKEDVPLNMGTAFDEFSPLSHTAYFEKHCKRDEDLLYRQNRRILYNVMINAGFYNYCNEWWHFAYGERLWSKKTGKPPIYGYFDPTTAKIQIS